MATRKSRRPLPFQSDKELGPEVVFGRLLRRYRNRANRILKEAAEALELKSVTYVSDVECAKRKPFSPAQLRRLCDFYRCSEEETQKLLTAAALAVGRFDVHPEPRVAALTRLFADNVNRLSDADAKRIEAILRGAPL